jgi:hypothetical protein
MKTHLRSHNRNEKMMVQLNKKVNDNIVNKYDMLNEKHLNLKLTLMLCNELFNVFNEFIKITFWISNFVNISILSPGD